MKPADDAVIVETDGLSAEEVVRRLVAMIEARSRA
jgi:cytidylate kinase